MAKLPVAEQLRALGATYVEEEDRWYSDIHRQQWLSESPEEYLGWLKGFAAAERSEQERRAAQAIALEASREQEVRRLVLSRLKSSIQGRLPQPVLSAALQRHGLFLKPEALAGILETMEAEGLLSTSISVVELTTKGARS